MSIVGIMDSRIDVYGIDDGSNNPTNRLGEPGGSSDGAIPDIKERDIRCSVQMHGYGMRAKDQGAGDQPSGYGILYFDKKSLAKLGDIVHIKKGPMADSWWQIADPVFSPTRTSHREAHIQAYLGPHP